MRPSPPQLPLQMRMRPWQQTRRTRLQVFREQPLSLRRLIVSMPLPYGRRTSLCPSPNTTADIRRARIAIIGNVIIRESVRRTLAREKPRISRPVGDALHRVQADIPIANTIDARAAGFP